MKRQALERHIKATWSTIAAAAGTRDGGGTLPKGRLSILGSGTKTEKGMAAGFATAVVYLAPANSAFESGDKRTMCPNATAQCAAVCLGIASGRMPMRGCSNARLWKTTLFLGNRRLFNTLLDFDIAAFVNTCHAAGYRPAVRFDGSSDTGYGATLAARWPEVDVYDYTKNEVRAVRAAGGGPLHVTFSYSGRNQSACNRVLTAGGNVAIVFDTPIGAPLPATWCGMPVIDGDVTDLRFLDNARGAVVGLRFKAAKGRAAAIESAGDFVVRVPR